MSKVSYIIGAGASYGGRIINKESSKQEIRRGLPILQEFSDAVSQLEEEISKIQGVNKNINEIISSVLKPIKYRSIEFPTIDTYAKMLFATQQFDEYEKFKVQLSIFFLIWQSLHKHDLRYDSFIASLIDAHTGKLPAMTILSWNYDMQLEMSYANYIPIGQGRALWKIWDELNVYCKSNGSLKYSAANPFAFIKLNGSAMFHAIKQDERTLRYTLQDVLWCSSHANTFWDDVYNLFNKGQLRDFGSIPDYQNELSYAWDDFGKEQLYKTISNRCDDCEVLVIIGYSFPYVNREIDRYIFSHMSNLNHIYIQDLHTHQIKEKLKAIYDYLKKPIPIIDEIDDLSSFYIPNELG